MIVASAARLCDATFSAVARFDGELLHLVAVNKMSPEETAAYHSLFPRPALRNFIIGRAFTDGVPVHVEDIETDPDYDPHTLAVLRAAAPYRSYLGIPILRDGVPIGAIGCGRREVKPFTEAEIALVQTFADQAVIAIENTRLFEAEQASKRELTEALDYQTATSEVLSVIGRSTSNVQPVFDTIVRIGARLFEPADVTITTLRGGKLHWAASTLHPDSYAGRAQTAYPIDFDPERSPSARAILGKRIIHIPDALAPDTPEYTRYAQAAGGFRSITFVPLVSVDSGIGTIILTHPSPGFKLSPKQLAMVQTFADQCVIAIENARLLDELQTRQEELETRSTELEIASQHKSQFVANMSHELRTPLAAILGYAELMQEGFYEPQGNKSMAALTRIRSNGKHLLGLINTVLDIAKIESGQFSLNLGEYAIESVVETVRAATESLAETKKLALKTDVAKKLPVGLGDEQRLTQVLLNLVGNAIKFTDTGEVSITATANNGHFTVAVTDTGPGIPPEELKRVFEQFHQIDNSNTKAKGGTGLGLAIAKQIVEMHGGRIWVESTLGKGATFQMELPVRAEVRKGTPAS